jgi:amino-acid N-acetyltransferase
MITYSFSEKSDLESIIALLKKTNLPYSDIRESPVNFIVVKEGSKIIGCIGIEMYDTEGLLRSFVVDEDIRKKGYGKELYNRLLVFGIQKGVKNLHLLTNTAKDYFLKAGFTVQNRIDAPETIKNSAEFKSICPASSTYMVLKNIL